MTTTAENLKLSEAPEAAKAMTGAARAFLGALAAEQSEAARFQFQDEERLRWDYRPHARAGVSLKEMSADAKRAALSLVSVALSSQTEEKTRSVMALETILAEQEAMDGSGVPGRLRDPELYYFSVYGEPGGEHPWGWQVDGHHVSFNFTVVDGRYVGVTPAFLGANPAKVVHGESKGFRALAEEEDYARDMLALLDPEQKEIAIADPVAPPDIYSDNNSRVTPFKQSGVPFSSLSDRQRDGLVKLVRLYVDRMPTEVATAQWKKIEAAGLDSVTFTWMGLVERGEKHYYSVQGPRFLIEYDNTQNGGNHIHSVWRDYEGDWGEDLLHHHYQTAEHGHHD
ncbi:MAG: DUF3500 domain-containing protein [Chloroflexota bacterium]